MAASVTVECPHCGRHMQASAEHVGRQGRCPFCRSLVSIRPSEPTAADTLPAAQSGSWRRLAPARLNATEVPGWLSAICGAAATGAVYLGLMPLRQAWLGQLFFARGPIPYVITLVTCWGLAILVLKYVAVRKQRSAAEKELELIPLEVGVQIASSNVDQFLAYLGRLGRQQRESILARRIAGALEYFRSRKSVPELQQYLATQAEIDASSVDAGYTLLRAFIWVVPILGFIGTVWGISDAVFGLKTSLAGGRSDDLMTGLASVTAGLAVAFDTTLVALVMAILLLFPTEWLRKTEYAMLDRIEAFMNHSLLPRMADEESPIKTEQLPKVVREALESAFQEHQRWLAQWQTQVRTLGQDIGRDFEAAVARLRHDAAKTEAGHLDRVEQLQKLAKDLFDKIEQATVTWQQAVEAGGPPDSKILEAYGDLRQALAENSRALRDSAERHAASGPGDSALASVLQRLNQELARLSSGRHAPGTPAAATRSATMVAIEPVAEGASATPAEGTSAWFGWLRRPRH